MKELLGIAKLIILFIILGIFFWYSLSVLPKFSFWSMLLFLAIVWFLIEAKMNWKNKMEIKKALAIGLFLMIFDFVFENFGSYLGLWRSSYSLFFVLTVPIEIMGVTLLGGTAWALYLPRIFNKTYIISDILTFSAFGALGEFILISNGIMTYLDGWISLYAFFSYMITWLILHILKYRVIK